jgi:hypothetical protein
LLKASGADHDTKWSTLSPELVGADPEGSAAGAVSTHEVSHAPADAITEADHALIDHTGLPGVGAGGGGVSVPTFSSAHAAGVGTLAWYNDTSNSITIQGVRVTISAIVADAPTVVDVNVDGTSALVSPILVPVGQNTSGKTADEIVVPVGSSLTVDVDSVGDVGSSDTLIVQFYV